MSKSNKNDHLNEGFENKIMKTIEFMIQDQAKLNESVFIGSACQGKVRVEAMGSRLFQKIAINDSLLDPSAKNELEKYLLQAINTIIANIDEETSNAIKVFRYENTEDE